MSSFQKATKRQVKARVALDGPSGSGKTFTALTWAAVLGQRTAVIDTERGSASLYSDQFDFDVVEMAPPYDPHQVVALLKEAERAGYDVVILDSLTHLWSGEGGVLDQVDAAAARSHGNTFAGWKTGTPIQRHLIDTILGLDAHVIATMRSKQEWVLEEYTDKSGRKKTQPKRVGMAPEQRQGVEYEFTVVGGLDLDHRLTITKSRCAALADVQVEPGRAADAAQTFAKWLTSGEPVASTAEVSALVDQLNAIADEDDRKAAKQSFVARFGRPESLLAAKLDEARTFVAEVSQVRPAPDADGGGEAPVASEPAPSGPNRIIGTLPSARSKDQPPPKTPGQQIHIQAGEVCKALDGDYKPDLLVDSVVLAVTELRTDSTKEIDQREANVVARKLNDIRTGRVEVIEHFMADGTARYGLIFDDAELVWNDDKPELVAKAVAS